MNHLYRFKFVVVLFFLPVALLWGQTDTLTILHLNDTHSNLAPLGPRTDQLAGTQGGIARAASVIGMTKMTESNVLVLHGGDMFIGDLFYNVYFGVPELQMMLALGLDAMVVGNHEFDLTPATLLQALDSSFVEGSFPLVSANVILEDPAVQPLKNYITPFTVKDLGATRVGIFGLTTPETNILSQPQPAVVDTNIVEIAAAMVDSLTARGCHVIICLSHLGIALDRVIGSYVPGIHVIVGGHDHYLLSEPEPAVNPLNDTTWIMQANAFYQNIGKLRIVRSGSDVGILDYQMIALDESIPEEPTIAGTVSMLVQGIENTYGPVYSEQITYAADYFEEVAGSLLADGFRDTPVGNLVTDAFRATTNTDIAICVGGSTAQPLYPGPIVGADIFRMLGYGFNTDNGLGYRLATFTMTGAALYQGLEFGLSSIELNDEYFVQGSGFTYWYAPSHPPYERVLNVEVGGVPLDPLDTYTVTANEFVPVFLDFLGISYSDLHVFPDTTEYQVVAAYVAQTDTIHPQSATRILSPVHTEVQSIPEKFTLHQNYPNPFNPSTTIRFENPQRGFVTLEVYDLLGRRMAVLVNGMLDAGNHVVTFDAGALPTGIYLYRISTNSTSQTRRMILLK